MWNNNPFKHLSVAVLFVTLTSGLISCSDNEVKHLPILGIPTIVNGDTIHHTIRDFTFVDQDSNQITKATFKDKIYVSDFFFTSCPSICPIITREMKRIYETFEDENDLMFISHSIDTRHDSVPVLKAYADKLNIDNAKWKFITGDKSLIYEIANDYFNVAYEDEDAPGGYDHSGKLILVDKNGHVRSYCEGTDHEAVTQFIKDISFLLAEQKVHP